MLSEKNRINLLIMKEDKKSYQEICDLFNAREPISKSTIVEQFSVSLKQVAWNRSRNGRPTSVSNDKKSATILQSFKRLIRLLEKLLQKTKSANYLCVIF